MQAYGRTQVVIKKMGYQWHLRRLMAGKELWQTTDLVPLLAERGITTSCTAHPTT
jgi:hypothetical protein